MAILARERSACEFGGQREGSAPLNWGQYRVQHHMRHLPPGRLNISTVFPLPDEAGLTVPEVSELIGRLVTRHEALRTRILPSESGGTRQIVTCGGVLPLMILRCEEDSADSAGQALRSQLGSPPFDYSTEGPLRAGLVVVGHQVRQVVLVLCRLVADFFSFRIVHHEMQLLLRGEALSTEPALQPLDLSAQQESPRWQRHSARALAYWTEECERYAPRALRPIAEASDPPVQCMTLVSEALWLATGSIARRYGVSTSSVLLAAFAAMIGRWTGNSACAISVAARNRFLPQYNGLVTSLSQHGLFVMDLAGRATVDELVESAADAALRAYRYAYYDQEVIDAAIARISDKHGTDVSPTFFFNDLRPDAARSPAGDSDKGIAEPTSAAIRAAAQRTRLHTREGMGWVHTPVSIKMQPNAGPGAMHLDFTVDTRYLPADRMEPFIRDFEKLVLQARSADAEWP